MIALYKFHQIKQNEKKTNNKIICKNKLTNLHILKILIFVHNIAHENVACLVSIDFVCTLKLNHQIMDKEQQIYMYQ